MDLGAVKPSIKLDAFQWYFATLFGATLIVHAERRARVVAEIKLRDVALKMLLAAMLIDAFHAEFEHFEIAF